MNVGGQFIGTKGAHLQYPNYRPISKGAFTGRVECKDEIINVKRQDRAPISKRRRVKGPNKFLDLEADDDDREEEEEEEEEEDDPGQGLDAEPGDDGGEFEDISLLSRLHLEEQMSQSDSTIARITKRYVNRIAPLTQDGNPRASEVARFERLNADLDPSLRERLRAHTLVSVAPCEDDWVTWEVPVPTGREELTVYDVLLIAERGGVHRWSTPPRSAYTAHGITGHIYVEAQTRNDVISLFKPIRGVRWWEVKVVTRADSMKLLNRHPGSYTPRPNTWVHLKSWPFKNDLAFIQEVLQRDMLRVIIIPRLWYHRPPEFKQPGKCPTAKPFNRSKALGITGPSSVVTIGSGSTAKHLYFDIRYDFFPPNDSYTAYDSSGFQDLVVDSSDYFAIDVYPKLSEITPFMTCVSIPYTVKLLHIRLAENRRLKNGDRVLVVSTLKNINSVDERHVGRTGIIDDIADTFACVQLPDLDSGLLEAVQVPLSSVRRHYKIGDYVKVRTGGLREQVGWVTSINHAEDQITIYNPKSPEGHLEVLASLTEFAEIDCRMGQNPHRDFIDMSAFELSVYENLPITVLGGPLKGRSGVVKTISLRLKAKVELRGSYASSRNQLQELDVGDLAFELDLHKWYRLQVKSTGGPNGASEVQLEAVHSIPATCSMLATIPENNRSKTPEAEPNLPLEDGPWSPNYSNPSGLGISADVVPRSCWLTKLPHISTFRTLKLSIQSFGSYENGKWDGKIGFYKGLSGSQVDFFSQDSGLILVPFYYVNPVCPTKALQNAHCLAEGPDLGKRFKIQKFGEKECEVVPFHGGRPGKARQVATSELAVIG
ncbi:hypothetical protein NP233_g329 [Leucocoprinus birnbaumii]|uniref:KOW domain-containing protein n=1 Tax=Leucocoprinus birnbaumii TaxID=56174 RepID=A0AAD5W208_9AGAR|nr:hypothetical protein NP233_g329 [Leucocoprinus birnbaumii]